MRGREGEHHPEALPALPARTRTRTRTRRLLSQKEGAQRDAQVNDPAPGCGEMPEVSTGSQALTFVIYKIKTFFIDRLKALHILRAHTLSGTGLGDL